MITIPKKISLSDYFGHFLSMVFLLAVTVYLFRYPVLFGYRLIGNSDRLNHYLSFIQFYTDNFFQNQFSVWSEQLLMGFDSLSEPFSFFQPLFLVPFLLSSHDVIKVFGYITPCLLFITLIFNYLILYGFSRDRLSSLTGSCILAFSLFSLLKLIQNDNTYLSVLIYGPLFYLVHSTNRYNQRSRFFLLTMIVTCCIYIAFLQEFSYVILFLLIYGCYLWFKEGYEFPLITLSGSLMLAIVLGLPRLVKLYYRIKDTARTETTAFQEPINPLLFLRFLSGFIFGQNNVELQESLKLTQGQELVFMAEGNLLYSSIFASLLLLLIIFCFYFKRPRRQGFFINGIVVIFLIIHIPFFYRIFGYVYGNIGFLHGRLCVAALFPMALVTTTYLTNLPTRRFSGKDNLFIGIMTCSVLIISGLEVNSSKFIQFMPRMVPILTVELIRWLILGVIFVGLLITYQSQWINRQVFNRLLAIIIIGQSIITADKFLNASYTRNYAMPFAVGDTVMAKPTDFLPPSLEEISKLHRVLDNDNYRSILICPPDLIKVQCDNPIGLFWKVRLLSGYLSSISQRYESLPWYEENKMNRSINFRSNRIPWRLASLLNVKNAMVLNKELYMNRNFRVDELRVFSNPSGYIYPRVYFAKQTKSVSKDMAIAAINQVFGGDEVLITKHPLDYVEGPMAGVYDDGGEIKTLRRGDRIVVEFPSSMQPRFLILNEFYDSNWKAMINGEFQRVYPTNVVMRGIAIPPLTTSVILSYRPWGLW